MPAYISNLESARTGITRDAATRESSNVSDNYLHSI